MSNILIPKPGQLKYSQLTEEKNYHNRREVLKKLGLTAGAVLVGPYIMSRAGKSALSNDRFLQEDNRFNFAGMEEYYPAKRTEKYILDRPITEEYLATHKNNFYEFIHPKDSNIYNAYKYVDKFDNREWDFRVSGLARNKGLFKLEEMIKKIGLEERTYRFRCVEAWSMAVPWSGFSLASLIKFLEPDSKAKYVRMISYANAEQMPGVKHQDWYDWPYYEGLSMEEAMNELTFMATGIYGKPLPKQNGAPMRLVVPWKYGYKSTKSIVKIEFIDYQPETFWHKIAPREYGFISNVNPEIPHPRWSQAQEQMMGEDFKRPTLKYNGYGDYVARLYS